MTGSSILDANAYRGSDEDDALLRRRRDVLGPAYRLFYRKPIELVRGSGTHLYDADGVEYLDAYNNVASVGHAHPHVAAAVAEQVARLTTHTRYLDRALIDYVERLLGLLPPSVDRMVLTCTGSEANDLAIRLARAATGGTGLIVTSEAYHGNTDLVTGVSPSLGGGVGVGPDVWLVPAPDPVRRPSVDPAADLTAAVEGALAEMTERGVRPAALLVDSALSSDGIHTDRGLLTGAVAAVRQAGGVLIADEVQPGFARTGDSFWGFARHDVVPEIVTMGKPMGNGLPIAGVAAANAIMEPYAAAAPYFNTFGGTQVAVAAAAAVLDVIEREGLQDNARRVGEYFRSSLSEVATRHPVITDVRGAGLYVGVELVAEAGTTTPGGDLAADVVNGMRERRVLTSVCGPYGATLKVRPPLPFSTADVDRFCTELDAVLTALT